MAGCCVDLEELFFRTKADSLSSCQEHRSLPESMGQGSSVPRSTHLVMRVALIICLGNSLENKTIMKISSSRGFRAIKLLINLMSFELFLQASHGKGS